MSDSETATDDSNGLSIKREQTLVQKETVTIKSKRGTGTNDRDSVRKEVEREAELNVGDGVDLPDLIGYSEMADGVSDVAEAMAEVRQTNNGE